MKPLLSFGLVLLVSGCAWAQTSFPALKQQAADAYAAKHYRAAGQLYDQAFRLPQARPTDTDFYNAACTWALADDATKAFRYLDQATLAGWENVPHLEQDSDLAALHADKRWQPMLTKLRAAEARRAAAYNRPLKQQLDSIYALDQSGRQQFDAIAKKYGEKSAQMDSLWQRIEANDARNLTRVTALLEQHGWPTRAEVGRTGTQTVFLVIQHSNPPTLAKYLPLAKQAADRGDLAQSAYALMQDRLLMWQGKPQIYGSQLTTDQKTGKTVFHPIEDEAHVDERRAAIGMEPLASYAKRFGLQYTLPAK